MKNRKRILFYSILMLGLFLLYNNSCKKDDNKNNSNIVPLLNTDSISNITKISATCGGMVTDDRGAVVTTRGICWSTGDTPTISDSKTSDGSGIGNFTSELNGLLPNTTYYVRAYATTFAGTGYGNVFSFKSLPENYGIVTDVDGNIYHTITIGTQGWMVENLKVTHYRNGEPLPTIIDSVQWINLTTGATTYLISDSSYISTYGRLYNWYAANDPRNICPVGWHIPSEDEWTKLINYLGGNYNSSANKLKEAGNIHWKGTNEGNNESGFSALPCGRFPIYTDRFDNDLGIYYSTIWWSSSIHENSAWCYEIRVAYCCINEYFNDKYWGYSIRCIKDNTNLQY